MHGNVINVFANVDQTQSILPRLQHDGATIGVFFKRHLEYKSPCMSKNVRPNMVMVDECTLRWFTFCVMMLIFVECPFFGHL
jgi:hypothetical protein